MPASTEDTRSHPDFDWLEGTNIVYVLDRPVPCRSVDWLDPDEPSAWFFECPLGERQVLLTVRLETDGEVVAHLQVDCEVVDRIGLGDLKVEVIDDTMVISPCTEPGSSPTQRLLDLIFNTGWRKDLESGLDFWETYVWAQQLGMRSDVGS